MTVQRPLEHYEEHRFFGRHPDIVVMEAVENLWLAEHDHDFLEIVLVAEGRGTQYLNGVAVQVESGDVFAIPVGTRHIFRPTVKSAGTEKLKVWNCLMHRAAIRKLAIFLGEGETTEFLAWLVGESNAGGGWLHVKDATGELRQTFRQLFSLYAQPPGSGAASNSLSLWGGVISLLAAMLRHASDSLAGADDRHSRFSDDNADTGKPLQEALAYMRRHCAESVTIEDAAAAARISGRQLRRLFGAATGRSFRDHLEEIRMESCCRLLRDTRIPIMDLPPLVGYEQWKSLNRVFRKRMGVSLGQYRRRG